MRAYYDRVLGRVVWNTEPEFNPNNRLRERGPEVHATPTLKGHIDPQLPLWYEPHRKAGGKFYDGKDGIHPKGACIVDSYDVVERGIKIANAEHNEGISWEQPFRRIH